ncbi:MAG TPA: hypothetical protein VGQ24_05090 [Gemmatimonadales bacterium]|jgi:hypothetical protein|nr:hypothetical protein [Gemmatimonadales bacterium]
MSIRWIAVAAAGMLMAFAVPATAQRAVVQQDSAEAQLRGVLRAFYFNLAHHDWEAIAADVLSAKVVASRSAPSGIQTAPRDRARAPRSSGSANEPVACSSSTSAGVDEAAIHLDGEWAGVSIPRCGAAATGVDEFRLIHIEKRWRFVYIDLFEEPMIVPD